MARFYKHHRGVDATPINTPEVQRIGALIDDIIKPEYGIGVVHGDAGLGKTFGVGCHLARVAKKVEVVRMTITQRPTEPQVLRLVLGKLLGAPTSFRASGYQLQPEVLAELSHRPRLLVIDEAQKMTKVAIEALRHLHDDEETQFGLLLIGGNGCWEVLSSKPMLRSRVDGRVHLEPWGAKHLKRFIPQYHPLYEDVDLDTILEIDSAFAHGHMRAWASFTRKALDLMADSGKESLDAEVIANVYATESGHVSAPEDLPETDEDGQEGSDA